MPVFGRESGQMAVELAVVLPVILVALVLVLDCMLFISECARFDNIAPQKTLALAVSPAKGSYGFDRRVESVRHALSEEFKHHGERVEVICRDAGDALPGVVVYDLELSMEPWPLGGAAVTVFGVRMPPRLSHSCRLAFDPYTPGQL